MGAVEKVETLFDRKIRVNCRSADQPSIIEGCIELAAELPINLLHYKRPDASGA